jgi:hypothetical protein
MRRISYLFLAPIWLSSIIISLAAENSDIHDMPFKQIENRRIVMSPQDQNSKQGEQRINKATGAIYSIVSRNRTPRINPGGKVEIEIFLSGYGMPENNKLYIQWSSPYIINRKDVGILTSCIAFIEDRTTGKTQPAAGNKFADSPDNPPLRLLPTGATIILNRGYFSDDPVFSKDKGASKSKLVPIMAESSWDDLPPLYLKLNTAKDAPSGDYDISFIFTYGDSQNLLQDYKLVQFHITSWWERNQGWVVPIGVVIAFFSFINAAFGPNTIRGILSSILKIIGLK